MTRSLLGLLFLVFLQVACGAPSLDDLETVDVPTPAYARKLEIEKIAQRLLEARDTSGLEQIAESLRSSKEALDGGTWLLTVFYDTLDNLPDKPAEAADRMAFFEKWASDHPKNITAQVCLANAYTSYAWAARGSGWADSVSKDGWKLFEERLDQAWSVLQRAQKLEEKCPGWYQAAQTVALGQGWEREDYMKMVDQALAAEPTYGRYITNACYWLLPRWNGEAGDYEKWLAQLAEAHPPESRDRYYAYLVWMADRMAVSGEVVFSSHRLDWARTKRGFEAWLKDVPENLMVHLEFIRLALLANDRATVRQQFEIIGPKYFPPMWKNEQAFRQAWNFGFNHGPNPLLSGGSSRRSGPGLDPHITQKVTLVAQFGTRLAGGLLAGVLLLVLALQRGATWLGVGALLASLLLAPFFGTIASVAPALLLWLVLRRRPPPDLPVSPVYSGWLTLLGLAVLVFCYFGLQVGATMLLVIPMALANPAIQSADALSVLVRDGTLFAILLNSSWITFLLLLVICRPQSPPEWQRRLGLTPQPLLPTILWALVSTPVVFLIGSFLGRFMDAKSIESIKLLSQWGESPTVWFLSLVVAGPVLEELMYRGYAFAGWVNNLGVTGTIFATSLFFALTHLQYGWVGLLYIFLFGLVLGVVRWRTGNVYACIFIHAMANLLSCLSAAWSTQ